MNRVWPRFFGYIQSADFYRGLHRRAVRLLPHGNGKTWFDVGTGPGLVALLAAEHGYRATGFDLDPAMIAEASARLHPMGAGAEFEASELGELAESGRKADVVSAASLLAVIGDRKGALRQLMSCVNEGGVLLVIETTERMKPSTAFTWLMNNGFGRRNWLLLLWALARSGGTSVSPAQLGEDYRVEHTDIFGGFVDAWVVRRKAG